MRTTLTIQPVVLENAKAAAAARGVTLSEFMEDAVRVYLSPAPKGSAPAFTLHTVRGQLVQPDLDLDRTSLLLLAEDEAAYQNPA